MSASLFLPIPSRGPGTQLKTQAVNAQGAVTAHALRRVRLHGSVNALLCVPRFIPKGPSPKA